LPPSERVVRKMIGSSDFFGSCIRLFIDKGLWIVWRRRRPSTTVLGQNREGCMIYFSGGLPGLEFELMLASFNIDGVYTFCAGRLKS